MAEHASNNLKKLPKKKKPSRNVNPRILELFWKIADINFNTRSAAIEQILKAVQSKQHSKEENYASPDLAYCVERLLKGLSSGRNAARQGFAVLLTLVLQTYTCIKIDDICKSAVEFLPLKNKNQESGIVIGRTMAYGCLIRSRRLANEPGCISEVVQNLKDLSVQKGYVQQMVCYLLEDLLQQIDISMFKTNVWPNFKKELAVGWDTCTADSLWLLLLCHKKFPEVATSKFLSKHWGSEEIVIPETYLFIGAIIKKSTVGHPFVHPLCLEVISEVIERKLLKGFWSPVVEGQLLEPDKFESTFLVFQLTQKALVKAKKAKQVQIILSPKLCQVFTKAALTKYNPLNAAAIQLCRFLVEFASGCGDASIQTIILKCFILPPGTILFDVVTKNKFVEQLLSKLKPEVLQEYSGILKDMFLNKDELVNSTLECDFDSKRCHIVKQMAVLAECEALEEEMRVQILQYLLLHSFFDISNSSDDIPLCTEKPISLSSSVRAVCQQSFMKGLEAFQRPHSSGVGAKVRIKKQLTVMLPLVEFANLLLNSPDVVRPVVDVEKMRTSWDRMMQMIHKLNKWSKKDGKEVESDVFKILFLYLGLQLFVDFENVNEKLDELHECCKRALKQRRHSMKEPEEIDENEPFWVDVVIDLMLSLLSDGASMTRIVVQSVFSLLSPFVTKQSLQQILDVLNSGQDGGPLVLDEDSEDEDVEFESGSSSEEEGGKSEAEIDDTFRTKIQKALGGAADLSGDESETYMTDNEMMQLDEAIGEAFGQMIKKRSKTISKEDEALLHFRLRCLDLIMRHLKSEPPLANVLQTIAPLVATAVFALQNQLQRSLADKTLQVLHTLTQVKKFSSYDDVKKETFAEIMQDLISRAKKASEPRLSQLLGSLCIFVVTCSKKWLAESSQENSKKKKSKKNWHLAVYSELLKEFFEHSTHNIRIQMFEQIMTACPEMASEFLPILKNHSFCSEMRLYKKTQAFGLMALSLKQIMVNVEKSSPEWSEICADILPKVVSATQEIDPQQLKPMYTTKLLYVLHVIAEHGKKLGEEPLLEYPGLVEILQKLPSNRLDAEFRKMLRKLILLLGGSVQRRKDGKRKNKRKRQNSAQTKKAKTEVEN